MSVIFLFMLMKFIPVEHKVHIQLGVKQKVSVFRCVLQELTTTKLKHLLMEKEPVLKFT